MGRLETLEGISVPERNNCVLWRGVPFWRAPGPPGPWDRQEVSRGQPL